MEEKESFSQFSQEGIREKPHISYKVDVENPNNFVLNWQDIGRYL